MLYMSMSLDGYIAGPHNETLTMTHVDLREAAHRSFVGSFRKLVQHVAGGELRDFGTVAVFSSGLPVALFNGCVVADRCEPDDLDAALVWLGDRGQPHSCWVAAELGDGLELQPERRGLVRDPRLYPGMALHPLPPVSATGPTDVEVRSVVDDDTLNDHLRVLVDGGLTLDLAQRLFTSSFAADPDVRMFTAYLDGVAVGTSIALRTDDVGGVYGVGTVEWARRRGVGSSATWAAVEAGREWGCEAIVLQSTAMGMTIYEAMGFRTVVDYVEFRSPPRTPTKD